MTTSTRFWHLLEFFVVDNAPFTFSIVSVTTYSAILSNTNNPRGKIQLEESAYSGWFWTLGKIVFLIGVVAGVLYGYKIYALRSAQSFNSYPRSPGIGGAGFGFYEKRY